MQNETHSILEEMRQREDTSTEGAKLLQNETHSILKEIRQREDTSTEGAKL